MASFSSCNTTKYLNNNERLLSKNTIELETKELTKDEKNALAYQLSTITKQEPNSSFRLWLYQRAIKKSQTDTSAFNRWIINGFGEKPVIFDSTRMESTVTNMEYYLNNRGFFDAKVKAKATTEEQKVQVVYNVNTHQPLLVDGLQYISKDSVIQEMLQDIKKESLIKKGEPISTTSFNQEKNRIAKAMQNRGYAYMYPNYVIYEGDTTQKILKANVKAFLVNPTDSTKHQQYVNGKIFIHTDYTPINRANIVFDTIEIEGYFFIKAKNVDFQVKTQTLLDALVIRTGERFSAKSFELTRRQLTDLNIYKFVRIKYTQHELQDNILEYNIYLNLANKMEFGADLEVNTIQGSTSAFGNSLGIFGNLLYKNKNLNRGAEIFSINPVAGLEFALDSTNRIFNTIDLRMNSEITFPKQNRGWLKGSKSSISANYAFVRRFLFYTYNSLAANVGLDWEKNNRRHTFNPISINFLSPTIDQEFQPILDESQFLANSFTEQLIVGNNYTYTYASPQNRFRESYFFRSNVELAGNSFFLLNEIISPNQDWTFINGIPFSQYVRFELDGHFTKQYANKRFLAFRANMGVASGFNNKEVPYVKQFFVGGSSGIRAWRVREIGPGTFDETRIEPPFAPTVVQVPYQTGDFKLELSAEYRFLLWSYFSLEGAVFVDAGNIWTLKEDADRPGSQLTFDFWEQLAVGTGFGVRRDFSYFLIRVDLAYKVVTPYVNQLTNSRFYPFEWDKPVINLAIGYPF